MTAKTTNGMASNYKASERKKKAINRVQRQPTGQERTPANHPSDKRLIYKIIRNSATQQENNTFKNAQKI